ncbi:MAG: glycosyltransferase, partial [Candidatus Poribacteria bacterium]|nr:glycosyltransferase [Candidatus Poribacteria bacterium]
MLIKLRSSVLSTLKIASRVSSRESEFPPTKRVFCESTLNARLAFRRIQWERSPNVTFTRKISVDTPVGCLVVVKNDMISVIIPILNEEKILEKTLSRFQPELKNHELIIVDGGSIDGSISIAEKYGKVIKSERGRAKQLNAGAASAIGEILVFLHADVWLEAGAFAAVETALSSGYVGGGFLQKIDGRSILYRIIEITADMRGKYLKVFYGDSGIFVKRCDFER